MFFVLNKKMEEKTNIIFEVLFLFSVKMFKATANGFLFHRHIKAIYDDKHTPAIA